MRRIAIPCVAKLGRIHAAVATASGSLRFMVTPTTTATTTMQQGGTVTVEAQDNTPRCPVAGMVPGMSCPMEEGNAIMTRKEILSQLGKSRLSGFVASTAVVGYTMCGGFNPLVIGALGVGTYLQGLSANGINQCIEVENDRLMKRTAKRPLVVGAITRTQAVAICSAELAAGTAVLASVSTPAAGLGLLTWALYVGMYTPLKKISTTNTWWGAVVGAIPPLMGGVAYTGSLSLAPVLYPAYILGAVMFVWQIPHFMSLAFHCRRDYEGAGFKMLAFDHPTRASVYAVSLTAVMAGLTTVALPICGMAVEPWFYPPSIAANGAMLYKAVRFHMDPNRYCRSCFVFSYLYLAIILALFTLNSMQPVTQITGFFAATQGAKEEEKAAAVTA
jgi:protoheme IX farnesyltransferase